MSMKNALPILAGAVVGFGVVASDAQAQFTSDEIVREMVPAIENVPAGIEGALLYERKRNRTDFTIVVEGLPIGAYQVLVDGDFVGFMSSFRSREFDTEAELVFSTRQRGNRLLLNFEPREALVEIRSLVDNDRLYVSGRLPFSVPMEENEPVEFENVRVRQDFATLDGPAAEGRIDIRSNRRQARLDIRTKNLPAGIYELRADGMPIADLISVGRGKGRISFSTRPRRNTQPLTFEPTGVRYELVRTNLVDPDSESAELPSLVTTVGTAQDVEGDLMPIGMGMDVPAYAGFDADAEAMVMFENDPDFARLDIELLDAPTGQYQVLVEVAPGSYESLGNFQVVSLDPPADDVEEAPDEDVDENDELRQGVGPDNAGERTRGALTFTSTGFTREGLEVDEDGQPIVQLFFDDQGLPLLIVDGEDRVWFKGVFPDTGFEITSLVPLFIP